MIGYDKNKLMQVVRHRGYLTDRSVAQVIARVFGIKQFAATGKLMGYTRWTFEESFVIASYFQMTPKEYADTFLKGLFREDREGHFVCKVDDPGRLLRERTEKNKQKAIRKEEAKRAEEELRKNLSEEAQSMLQDFESLSDGI